MGFKNSKTKPSGQFMPTDRTKAGDISVSELQKKLASDQAEANKQAEASWDKQPTLTASQIAILDGSNRLPKKGEFNAIGAPVALQSGNDPMGFSRGTDSGESD